MTIKPAVLAVALIALGCSGAKPKAVEADARKALEEVAQAINDLKPLSQALTTSMVVAQDITVSQAATTAITVSQPVTVTIPVDGLMFPQRYVVEPGDTLWGIAGKLYAGNPLLPKGNGSWAWPRLCRESQVKDCDKIYPGQVLQFTPADRLGEATKEALAKTLKTAYQAK